MKTKLIGILSLFLSIVGYSQQDAQFTQYMYNTISVNPAYAGSKESLSVLAMHRTQWVGFDGAPRTNTISIHTPISESKIGIGLSIFNDKIGPSQENNIAIDLSYTIPTSTDFKLAFGIKASANLLDIDFNAMSRFDQNNYKGETGIDKKFSPNIGAGIYLHSEKTYFGLSIPNFIETKHFDRKADLSASNHINTQSLHYYFIAGHVFDLSTELKFKPTILTKMVKGAPLQVDVSGSFLISDKFTMGIAYRWSAAVSAIVGFQASDSWYIGYGYDLETTRLAQYNSGSHEIFLKYELFKRTVSVVSPRFF
jgi:type IX secretion system PorP/SprF family membrane protein